MPINDPETLEQVYRFATEDYSKEGFVPKGALRSMTKQMVQSNLIDATAAAETPVTAYYDNGYVEEVKRWGFFDQLSEIKATATSNPPKLSSGSP